MQRLITSDTLVSGDQRFSLLYFPSPEKDECWDVAIFSFSCYPTEVGKQVATAVLV